jgi:two-component sensor histidine kinase
MNKAVETWRHLPPLARAWVISFLSWGFVAVLLGLQATVSKQDPWEQMLLPGIRDWLPWAVATPLIFRLAQRLPIDRQRWRLALPVHILCAVAAVLVIQWWRHEVQHATGLLPPYSQAPMTFATSNPQPPGTGEMKAPLHSFSGPGGQGPQSLPSPQSPQSPYGPAGPSDMLWLATYQLSIYLMLMSGAHTLTFYRRSLDRESSLAIARAEAQKMQLQPHFLFNTLNMIAELVHEEPDKADAMLIALSGLLRLTMETAGEQELPLRRELEFIERYLTIMHARFEDRLKFQLGIDPATHAALVPTFLLQPLVENAIEHGLGPSMSGGVISIRSRRVGDELHLCVSDNGVGLADARPGAEGIGLGNTRNRLRELYGDAARLDMQDTGGLIVDIRIPFHLA